MAKEQAGGWGKLQLGQHFQMLALDVFRALAHSGLGTYEWIVMQYVIEQSWHTSLKQQGKAAPAVPCNLSTADLARAIEGDESSPKTIEDVQRQLRRARQSLLDKNLIRKVGEQYEPNKDADTWTMADKTTPLLSDARIEYARRIQFGNKAPKPDKRVRSVRTNESGLPDKFVRSSGQTSPDFRTNLSGRLIEERARKKTSADLKQTATAAVASEAEPETPEQKRRAKLIAEARSIDDGNDTERQVDRLIDRYGIEITEDAVFKTSLEGEVKKLWPYVGAICAAKKRESRNGAHQPPAHVSGSTPARKARRLDVNGVKP